MKKKVLSKLLGSRWAIRREAADIMASSDFGEGYVKEDGEVNHVNLVTKREDGIAVIHVDGALSYRSDFVTAYFGEDTYNSIESAFDAVIADEEVKGIIFDINSPGGEVSGCADLSNKIYNARCSKPYGIVARTGGLMCSAAYWLGSSCEKVYTAENGTLGSIGVLCSFTSYDSKLVKVNTVVSDLSPNKAPNPEDPEGLVLIKKELNDLASVFIGAVARNRSTTFENVLTEYGQGGVFIGAKAVEAGLADGVKSIEEIASEMVLNNSNDGGLMSQENKAAEVDVNALKQSIIAEERTRVKAINDIFAGLAIEETEAKAFIDEGKTVSEAKDFAFDRMKEMLTEKDEEIKALKASAPVSNAEQNAAMKAMLEKENQANANVQGGVRAEVDSAEQDKAIAVAFAMGSKN